ncbi:MFS-type transporter SLC18B1-like isoform X3 [Watersipora subatra]|uniref:MFS-type transporter SLC18B1-like isoform X3 n=1 Tax=Watersipora subatra TaxID=2589382 RepID=UPI00355C0784
MQLTDSSSVETNDNIPNNENSYNGRYTKRELILLACCLSSSFSSNIVLGLPAPFLPHLNEYHNIQSDITGWVMGLMPLFQMPMSLLYGRLMVYIAVKSMLVGGVLSLGVSTVAFGMLKYYPLPSDDVSIQPGFLIIEILLRIMHACGSAAVIVSGLTLLTTTFPHNTPTVMGYASTAMGVGFMCGPAIGSGFFAIGGFSLTFAAIGAMLIIQSIVILCTAQAPESVGRKEGDKPSVIKLLKNKTIFVDILLLTLVGVLWVSVEPILEPEIRNKYGLPDEISALIFLIVSLSYTVSSPLVGKAIDAVSWVTPWWMMAFGFVLHAVNFCFMGPMPLLVLLGFHRPLWLLIVTLAIMGIALAFGFVSGMNLIIPTEFEDENNEELKKNTKAMCVGFVTFAYSLGSFTGLTLSGVIAAYGSFGITMSCFAIACSVPATLIISTLTIKYVRNRNKANQEETQPLHSN